MLNLTGYLDSKKTLGKKSQATYHQEIAVKLAESLGDEDYIPQYLALVKRLAKGFLMSETELNSLRDKALLARKPGAYFLASLRSMLGVANLDKKG